MAAGLATLADPRPAASRMGARGLQVRVMLRLIHLLMMNPAEYKSAREQIGTQKEVADLLGLSREAIARRETGAPGAPITREAELALQFLLANRPKSTGTLAAEESLENARKLQALLAKQRATAERKARRLGFKVRVNPKGRGKALVARSKKGKK